MSSHPPYQLRLNKAIDRYLLLDLLHILSEQISLSNYTYYGMGGPFLEDCRIINERFPNINIVSIESDEDTYKRQMFHKFSRNLVLIKQDVNDFINDYTSNGREIIWLDYTDLDIVRFNQFKTLLTKAENNTIVKITLRAQYHKNPYLNRTGLSPAIFESKLNECQQYFRKEFDEVLPHSFNASCFQSNNFPILLQDMIKVSTSQALKTSESDFLLLNSVFYNDNVTMISITGIVVDRNEIKKWKNFMKKWRNTNVNWCPPIKIDVPILSVKERLILEHLLPHNKITGKSLVKALGYSVGYNEDNNLERLRQYAEFYKYYPYFAKVSV